MARVRIHPPIEIDELTIREYRLDDLDALDAAIVRNREYLKPWVGDWIASEPIGIERRRELLQSWVASYVDGADNPVGIFIGDELVGSTGLHDRNQPADVEIGYWVDEAHQGRGIATRAARALAEFALQHEQVERVLLIHKTSNVKSRRVPEKLGFRILDEGSTCGGDSAITWVLTRVQ